MRYGKINHPIVRTLIATAISACFAPLVFALPVTPTVTNGNASFVQSGNTLTVTNSNRAIINWNSFSIGGNENVRFIQPSSTSSVLNRVTGSDPSVLLGSLQSNGRVFLINHAGILVGQGARIDVAGFVASTLRLSDDDFLANRQRYTEAPGAGKVQNFGEITTPSGGNVYLIAPQVENHGIINAPNGEVLLAAGQRVELIDTATPGVKVEIVGSEGSATNLGTITAEAGRIGIAGVLVRNSGTLNASSLVSEGGRIFLKATTDTLVDGNSQIRATGSKGGRIEVLGNSVSVTDNTLIDASGKTAGGTVLVGGDYQGKNAAVQNAETTTFSKDAILRADASDNGDGGKVIVWADGTTSAYGKISARGGAKGGNGGFVEVSGKHHLVYRGVTNTSAPRGKTGTLLLDPTSIGLIAGAGTDTATTLYGDNITTNLGLSNLILQTSSGGTGNITFTAGTYDFSGAAAANSLTLLAFSDGSTSTGNISLPTGTFLTMKFGAPLKMVAGWDGASVSAPTVVSGFGSLSAVAGSSISAQEMKVIAGSNIVLDGSNTIDSVDLTTINGSVSYHTVNPNTTRIGINATGNITVTGDAGSTSIQLVELVTTGTSNVVVAAQGQILEGDWSGKSDVGVADVVTGSGNITLTSQVGTPAAGSLAISADVETSGTVSATVAGGPYGNIGIRDVGANQVASVTLNASAATNEGSLSYFRYGDLSLANIALSQRSTDSVAIGSSGDVTVPAGYLFGSGSADATLSVQGNLLVSGGNIDMRANANTIIAGGQINISAGKMISTDPGKPMDVSAGSILLNGGTLKADADLTVITPANIDLLAGGLLESTYGKLIFLADNLNVTSGAVYGKLGIDGTLFGGITLGALAGGTGYMNATNGIVDLAIGGSGIEMYNGSYINSTDATQPDGGLIKLFFSGLSGGGSMIDGVATFDGGYKVGGALTTLGAGLDVTYGVLSNPVSDALVDAFDKTTDSAGGTGETLDSLELAETKITGVDSTQSAGGSDGNFGSEETPADGSGTTTGNGQDGKNAKKKPAQCSA